MTILVIDDDVETRVLLGALMKDKSSKVLFAKGAAQGLYMAIHDKPDLIVLDIYMPGMDGLELLRYLRNEEATRRIPIMMLTAAAEDEKKDKAFLERADAYVTKPLDVQRFYGQVDRLLSGQKLS